VFLFLLNHQKTPVSPAFVKGIDLLTSIAPDTWPTGFDLEWSPDNRKFYPSKNAVGDKYYLFDLKRKHTGSSVAK